MKQEKLIDNAILHLSEFYTTEEIKQLRFSFLKHVNDKEADDKYALQKVIEKYKDELRTLGADHKVTQATRSWLQSNFPETWEQVLNEHELDEMEREFSALLEDFGPDHDETRRVGDELYERSGGKSIPPWRLDEFFKSLKRDPEPED